MSVSQLQGVATWATQAGLSGASEPDLLRGFCKGVCRAGLPLCRALVVIDTLHPVHEGHVFRWRSDQAAESEIREYGRTDHGEAAASWRRSTFYGMLQSGQARLRRKLEDPTASEYPIYDELREEGQTEYLAFIQRFAADGVIGEMDCIYSSWTTDAPGGFSDEEAAALEQAVLSLALAVKSASLARIVGTLVRTYLGRDVGRRVLEGRIQRGVADRIEAVLWFSDLRGFTRITDTTPTEDVIPFLNDYADAVISSIHEAGGDVLKLMGDGTLAIFTADDPAQACRCALQAEKLARVRVGEVNLRRGAASLPVTQAYLGLHIGEVFYGNIGSEDRLDFTVIGPAVNEVSRIGAMCRSAERDVLLSSAFVAALGEAERSRAVSVGRYALRGVSRPQELFALDLEVEP